MAHFAHVDENNIVTMVIVVDNKVLLDSSGNEVESRGADFCKAFKKTGRWLQTSYNHKIRGQYAGVGMRYNEELDVFELVPAASSSQ